MNEKRFYIQGNGIADRERKRLYDLSVVDGFISVNELLNEYDEKLKEHDKKITELTKYKIMVDLLEDSLSSRDVRSMIVNRYSKFETFEDVDAEIEKRIKSE